MDKDEILKKSVKENSMLDERDKYIRTHRDAFSMWGIIVLGLIMMGLKVYHGQSPNDLFSLLFGMVATASLYMAAKTKKLLHIILTIAFSALTLYYFYRFYVGVIQWTNN